MSLALENYTFMQQYAYSWLHAVPKKSEKALKLGVLSTATINPASIIHPVETHPDVVLYGIASRELSTAEKYARKYRFEKAYGTYEDLIADPIIDFVYISLPNSMHFEWALKAIQAGKSVLLEKPFTDNHNQAVNLVKAAEEKGVLLMEAYHWQFHPAAHLFRDILNEKDPESESGKGQVGRILKTESWMTSTPAVPKDDIRWKYDLGGGSLMDNGYVLSFVRFALGTTAPKEVLYAQVERDSDDPRIDASMDSSLLFTSQVNSEDGKKYTVHSTIYTDLQRHWAFHVIPRLWELPSIKVETEKKIIFFYNAMMPHTYHYISVMDKKTGRTIYRKRFTFPDIFQESAPGQSEPELPSTAQHPDKELGRKEKKGKNKGQAEQEDLGHANVGQSGSKKGGRCSEESKGKPYWSTYRYQLEAFVDKMKGREPRWWISGEESINQMKTVDAVYEKSGLGLRP